MCVSLGPATFSSTIVHAHATVFRGRRVHVLGYQNTAKSKVAGPNAMILPIPASVAMGPENAIDTRGFASVLRDYVQSLRRARIRSIESAGGKGLVAAARVQVFERGSYSIVLASDASSGAIMAAMESLPEARRPAINRAIFDAYLSWYPGWHLAICCFEGHVVAEPMLWWYEPMTPDELFLPGLDAHDGGVPDLGARVKLEHAIVVGIGKAPLSVSATLPEGVPAEIRPLLATQIDGWFELAGRCSNGDWWIRPEALERDHIEPVDPLVRCLPPGARGIATNN